MTLKRMLPLLVALCCSACLPAIHRAAQQGDIEQVRSMLDRGTDVNTKAAAKGSQTALHEAVASRQVDVVRLLLARGADVNARSGNLTTEWGPPLYWLEDYQGCDEKAKTITRLLIEAGADPSLTGFGKSVTTKFTGYAKAGDPCWQDVLNIVLDASAVRAGAAKTKARQAEQAQAQARLESLLPQIQAAERAGDEARRSGKAEEALSLYASAARLVPSGTPEAFRLRKKIVEFAAPLHPKPEVPEEANRHMMRGVAFSKRAKGSDGLLKAAKEMEQAIAIAPWWAEAYFNLALVQEKTSATEDAIANMKLYLLAAPEASDAGAVRKKIVDLEVAQESETGQDAVEESEVDR